MEPQTYSRSPSGLSDSRRICWRNTACPRSTVLVTHPSSSKPAAFVRAESRVPSSFQTDDVPAYESSGLHSSMETRVRQLQRLSRQVQRAIAFRNNPPGNLLAALPAGL